MPETGQSLMDAGPSQNRPEGERGSELLACVRLNEDESAMYLGSEGVASALYDDCDESTQQWALERLGSQSIASFNQPPRRLAWKSKPSVYVVCTEDRTIPAWQQRRMAQHATRAVELAASHSPFLSKPVELSQILAEFAHIFD